MIALRVCWSVGTTWLASWFRPIAASTAEKASSTGRPAATNAPKATIRIAIVSGSAVSSTRLMSLANRASTSCSEEACPNSSTIRLSCLVCTRSTAARIGAIFSFAFSALPLTSNCTSAECRSRDTRPAPGFPSGETMLLTAGCFESVWTTSATAAENAGCLNVARCDWTSTLSRAGILKSAASRICSARRDSPFAIAHGFICFAPTAPPTTTARTENAIHPKAARFQCEALQRPARPERFMASITHSLARRRAPQIRRHVAFSIAESTKAASGETTDLRFFPDAAGSAAREPLTHDHATAAPRPAVASAPWARAYGSCAEGSERDRRAPRHAGLARGLVARRVRRRRRGVLGGGSVAEAGGAPRVPPRPRERARVDGRAARGGRTDRRLTRDVRRVARVAAEPEGAARAAARRDGVRLQPRRSPRRQRRSPHRSVGRDLRRADRGSRRADGRAVRAVQPARRLRAPHPRQATPRRRPRLPCEPRDQPARRHAGRPARRRDRARPREPQAGGAPAADRGAGRERLRRLEAVPRDGTGRRCP